MSICFADTPEDHQRLLPLTFAKPVCELRVGILTIKEKWEFYLGAATGYRGPAYLQKKFPKPTGKIDFLINGSVLPDNTLISEVRALKTGTGLFNGSELIAARIEDLNDDIKPIQYALDVSRIKYPWDIFKKNDTEIRADYKRITDKRESQEIKDNYTRIYGTEIFIESGAELRSVTLNALNGPIYIGENALIEENGVIHGPAAICNESNLRIGGRIRPGTTIGPGCKVGGEISNSVIMGNSNKAHEGYLGNSVIGEWCNLGADTNTSNLKNNYTKIKLWDYERNAQFVSDLQFCGLIMGDHAKCGINTMFNSGSSVGFSSSVFGAGFPGKFIPSFAWGGVGSTETYDLEKAIATAEMVIARRDYQLKQIDREIFKHIFEMSGGHRSWEKT